MEKNEFVAENGTVLKIVPINAAVRFDSNKYYSKAFNEAIQSGLSLKIEIEKLLESRGLLDTSIEDKKDEEVRAKLKELEISLRKGIINNTKMTKEQGKAIALEMRKLRSGLGRRGRSLQDYFDNTVESYAENERLQFFIYATTVDAKTGNKYWKSFDDFKQDNSNTSRTASEKFVQALTNVNFDFEKEIYENKWLINRGFMNKDLQLIRQDGKLVDEEGRLIDTEGRFINESGGYVDMFGNPIDKDGKLLIEDIWDIPPVQATAPSVESVKSTEPEPFGS